MPSEKRGEGGDLVDEVSEASSRISWLRRLSCSSSLSFLSRLSLSLSLSPLRLLKARSREASSSFLLRLYAHLTRGGLDRTHFHPIEK